MSKLLINESPLQILPSLANRIGLNEAVVLQQIHYWLNPDHNKNFVEGLYWVYNSYEEWQAQFPFWSLKTLRRVFTSLEQKGLLVSRNLNDNKFIRTKWYTINYRQLSLLEGNVSALGQNGLIDHPPLGNRTGQYGYTPCGQNDHMEEVNMTTSLTETTPEITTEINTHQERASESTISQSFSELDNPRTQSKFPCESLPNLSLDEELASNPKSFLTPQNAIQPFPQPTFPTSAFPQPADLKSMVAMWNGIVRKSGSPVELTPERMPILAKRLVESFGSKLSHWQHYCRQIAKSSFLMGQGERGWKVTLDWALEPLNISKVLEGNYSSSADSALEEQVPLLPAIGLCRKFVTG